MTAPAPPGGPDDRADRDWQAAEYALGVLDAPARRLAEARALSEPAFAAEVEAWTERLAPMLDQLAGVEPSSELWRRIEAGLVRAEVVDLAGRRDAARPADDRGASRTSRWRGAAVAVGVGAAAVMLVVFGRGSGPGVAPSGRPPILFARLASEPQADFTLASYDPLRRKLLAQMPAAAGRSGRDAELWLIGPDGRPRALGIAAFGAVADLTLTESLSRQVTAASVLAVSVEPRGGSRTGGPTGPVVAKGVLAPA